jgi:hypothetical protein
MVGAESSPVSLMRFVLQIGTSLLTFPLLICRSGLYIGMP